MSDEIECQHVRFRDLDITIESIDIGNNFWFLKVTVDSYSASIQFRFDSEHLTYEQWIEFSNGKRDLYTTHTFDSAQFECVTKDGIFIFTVKHPVWSTSFSVPVEVINQQLYSVITIAYNEGYKFGSQNSSINGAEIAD